MKTFLSLCAAVLLLAVSLPLSAAPDADRDAVLRDEMEARLQLLEDKLSQQQERRLDELKNELHKLREERKTWLDDTQNPIIATAEKKKEEVRATGDRYVSMVGAGFTWVGALAAIVAIVPGVFSIISALLFNINAKHKIKEIDEMRKNIIEIHLDLVKKFNKRYQDLLSNYIEKINNQIRLYEREEDRIAHIVDNMKILLNEMSQQIQSGESSELCAKAVELIQKAKHLESQNTDSLVSEEELEQKQSNNKQTLSTESAALYTKAEQLLLQANELTPQSTNIILTLSALKIEQAKDATPDDQKIFLAAAEKYLDALPQQEHAKSLYDRACIAALRSQPDKALELLEECRQAGTLPSRKHLESDKDLDSLRDQDAFKEFMARAYPAKDSSQTKDAPEDSE